MRNGRLSFLQTVLFISCNLACNNIGQSDSRKTQPKKYVVQKQDKGLKFQSHLLPVFSRWNETMSTAVGGGKLECVRVRVKIEQQATRIGKTSSRAGKHAQHSSVLELHVRAM